MKLKFLIKSYKTIILFGIGLLVGFLIGRIFSGVLIKDDGIQTPISNVKFENKTENSPCSMPVEISGAVYKPAVYCLSEDSILDVLLEKAGGFTKNYASAYVSQNINRAEVLKRNTKVYIPFESDVKCVKLDFKSKLSDLYSSNESQSSCISINSSTLTQLDSLSGIGLSIAQKIVDGRPYKSIEDLKNISGIGDSLFEKIKAQLCL